MRYDPPHDLDRRIPELDGLRALASVAIVLYHANPKRVPCGWAAVDVFFVLSGFLITGIILRHGRQPGFLRSFYIRRSLRIWPIYYLTIAVFVLLNPWLAAPQNFGALPWDLTYTQNLPLYWTDRMPVFSRYLRHTWTLAIEEQFYLLWPLAVLVAMRLRAVTALCVAVVVGCVYARSTGLSLMTLGSRGDGLALGGLLAVFVEACRSAASQRWLARGLVVAVLGGGAGILALAMTVGLKLPQGPPPWPALTILCVNLMAVGVVGRAVLSCGGGSWAARFLRRPRLRAVGRMGYGLYLYHLPILLLSGDIARHFGLRGQPFWREGPTLALCFLAAWGSWRWVETPCLRLAHRLAPRDRPAQSLKPTETSLVST
jgi:peptidoglycan/LPS O-acetylase OafA/YrhL